MAARRVNADAGRELGVAVIEQDAPRIVQPHDAADVLDLEGMRQPRIAHVAPGGVGQLALLEMKARVRKAVEIADMVVMQMGEDDILDRVGIDAEQGQRSTGQRRNVRLRFSDTSALKPVSMTKVRPPPFATHTK